MNLPDNIDALRTVVRAEVVAALQRLTERAPVSEAPATQGPRQLMLLFTGDRSACPELLAQVAELAQQGYSFLAAFSRTFAEHNGIDALQRSLPPGAARCDCDSETGVIRAAEQAHGLVAGALSLNTAAKFANGISDSAPTHLLMQMVLQAKPVIIAQDLSSLAGDVRSRYPAIPPGLMRLIEDHFHKVQQLGVQFVPARSVADAVAAAFFEPSNETPSRLAVQRPFVQRQFVTAEDVWKARSGNRSELVCPADAIITDQARDYAEMHGIVIRQEQ